LLRSRWYRAKGAKLTNDWIATGIIECSCFDPKLADAALDPRCFAVEGGASTAEQTSNQLAAKVIILHQQTRIHLSVARYWQLLSWNKQ
jgi:hypothetical protein